MQVKQYKLNANANAELKINKLNIYMYINTDL